MQCLTYPENFMKIHAFLFNVANRHKFASKNRNQIMHAGGNVERLQIFQAVSGAIRI